MTSQHTQAIENGARFSTHDLSRWPTRSFRDLQPPLDLRDDAVHVSADLGLDRRQPAVELRPRDIEVQVPDDEERRLLPARRQSLESVDVWLSRPLCLRRQIAFERVDAS